MEGKLVEAGREPRNVQVVLVGADDGATVRLEDDGGMFLELAPAGPDADAAERDGGGSRESDETDGDSDHACASELREEIRRANEQIRALKEEVSSVRGELESERERGKEELAKERDNLANARAKYKELWSIYCARSARDDALIASKEKELEDLRNRLAEHEHHSTSKVTPLPRELGHDSPSPRVDLGPTREPSPHTSLPSRRGKAPPMDIYNGDVHFDDCIETVWRMEWVERHGNANATSRTSEGQSIGRVESDGRER